MEEEKREQLKNKLSEEMDKQLAEVLEQGVNVENITYLGKIIDIIKDKENIIYWKEKLKMRYMNYNEGYGRRGRDSRGRYNEGGYMEGRYNEGRNYEGEEIMEEMASQYGRYKEGRGRYGHDSEKTKSFDYMLMSLEDFAKHLFDEAEDEMQIEKIRKTAKHISEM